jgi:CAAX protease family protein
MLDSQPTSDEAAAQSSATVVCWRCGLDAGIDDAACPHCAARLPVRAESTSSLRTKKEKSPDKSLNLLLGTYAVLLVTGIVHALVLNFQFGGEHRLNHAERTEVFTQIAIVEAIDMVIIAGAVIASWGQHARPRPRLLNQLIAWGFSLPAVGGLLLINFGYHALLRNILHIPLVSDELFSRFDLIGLITICVQPAVVEELYCRLFALDCLRGVLGEHGAVWISATMFAFLHVALMGSVPYLILLGAVLGYMRLASGSILLPMMMHFVHNLVVLLI